ncbi:MAG: DUF3147 family protein [Alphaproteobacteria bacterium]|nr:DUF3147 family protein [Alphaproteobacteria bacterium]
MVYLVIKFFTSAALIVAISEIAKRYSFIAAVLASLPLTSLLAFIWLYIDTKDANKVAVLSSDIMWLVLPSLVFFIVLPIAIKQGVHFWVALMIAAIATAVAYGLTTWLMQAVGRA